MEIAEILRDKGYELMTCEPNIKEETHGFKLYSFEEILRKSRLLHFSKVNKEFKENIGKLKEKKIYDC